MRKVKITPELSKAVGWNTPYDIGWPNLEELKSASDYQILQWHRFLPSAITVYTEKVQAALHKMVGK